MPYYFGYLNKPRTFDAYNRSLFSMAMIGVASLVLGVTMMIYDAKNGKLLTLPENDEKVLEMRKAMQKAYNKQAKERALASYKSLKSKSTKSLMKIEEGSFPPIQE
jgi:hypothetical protein